MKKSFFKAIKENRPLQIVGVTNAYHSILAENVGHKSLYISGAGVANASYGLPDLAMTSLDNVLIDVDRISDATSLPVLVDIDTGWGGFFNISRTIKKMIKAGASAVHIEDQVSQKRCGHRPNKELVSKEEMCDRIKSACDGKTDSDFFIMARTDALEKEGLNGAIERAVEYVEAGADGIFAEAVVELSQYKEFKKAINVPLLANITEFGKTELYSTKNLSENGVDMVLYPLSGFRAANKAALSVFESIKNNGHQKNVIDKMQNREDLYKYLNYMKYEKKIDKLFN